ncbi:TIGR01841 family phasin [Paraburkholderia lacunae]|uniref:Phasin (PHA-granule associated protein) n=1 Tax=Paraburkholderia lacunae TaxID=2211104 RepID=A0A370N7A8_9BURK|nr:TIGR01841 family phasin [Paraburkholderia lacunae]RDK01471.1 Phasin (PHA-granule associated protein) [Paraburkholderia lacunae]
MSSLAPEQLFAAQKVGFETISGLLTKAFGGVEKLIEVNLQVVKSTLTENQEITAKALSAQNPQDLFALQASYTQSVTDKAQSYGRKVYEIISSTQSEFAAAAEAQFQKYHRETQEFVDKLAKYAPAGSETAVAAWKTFITTASETASTTYEAAKNATKQAVEIAESNVSAASSVSAKRTRQAVVPVAAVEK